MADQVTTPAIVLTTDQLQRAEAAKVAREVLRSTGGFAGGAAGPDAFDVVNVASWIITGLDPFLSDEQAAQRSADLAAMRDGAEFWRDVLGTVADVAEKTEYPDSENPDSVDNEHVTNLRNDLDAVTIHVNHADTEAVIGDFERRVAREQRMAAKRSGR